MSKIIIKTNYPEDVKIGSEVSTTTSEFEYDSVAGRFDNNLYTTAEVEVEHIAEDYSEYVQGKACNGGCYGFDYYKVVRVISMETEPAETIEATSIGKDDIPDDIYDKLDCILYEIPMEDE